MNSLQRGTHSPRGRRVLAARLIALSADLMQIILLPFFAPGGASPFDDALDIAVAGILVWLLGWNWALVPSLAAELVPGLDLFPTWTVAVLFVTRQKKAEALPEGERARAPSSIDDSYHR